MYHLTLVATRMLAASMIAARQWPNSWSIAFSASSSDASDALESKHSQVASTSSDEIFSSGLGGGLRAVVSFSASPTPASCFNVSSNFDFGARY